MPEAPETAALVTPAGRALRLASRHCRAAAGAVDLATITAAAYQHRCTAARAHEAARDWLQHEYPGEVAEGVLDGIAHGCNTGAAPVVA